MNRYNNHYNNKKEPMKAFFIVRDLKYSLYYGDGEGGGGGVVTTRVRSTF